MMGARTGLALALPAVLAMAAILLPASTLGFDDMMAAHSTDCFSECHNETFLPKCNCHGDPVRDGIDLVIDGPASIVVGLSALFTVDIVVADPGSLGPVPNYGYMVNLTDGAHDLTPTNVDPWAHSEPLTEPRFQFRVTAPMTPGQCWLHIAGLAGNEDDNTTGDIWTFTTWDLNIAPLEPDLAIEGLDISAGPEGMVDGGGATASATVVNHGGVSAKDVSVQFLDGGLVVYTARLGDMEAGETRVVNASIELVGEGGHLLQVKVRSEGGPAESDTSDNAESVEFQVSEKGGDGDGEEGAASPTEDRGFILLMALAALTFVLAAESLLRPGGRRREDT